MYVVYLWKTDLYVDEVGGEIMIDRSNCNDIMWHCSESILMCPPSGWDCN